MNPDVATLPDNPTALKQILVDFQNHYDKETGILLEQIQLLHAQLYGRKSEKIIPADGPQPLFLFDMPEPVGYEDDAKEIHVPGHTRKNPVESPFPRIFPGWWQSMILMMKTRYVVVVAN